MGVTIKEVEGLRLCAFEVASGKRVGRHASALREAIEQYKTVVR